VCDAVAGMIVYSKIPFEELGEHSIYGTHRSFRGSTQPQGKTISVGWKDVAIEEV